MHTDRAVPLLRHKQNAQVGGDQQQATVIDKLFELARNHSFDEFTALLTATISSDAQVSATTAHGEHKPFDVNTRDARGNYFLTYAVTFNAPALCSFLIRSNCRIDITDKHGRSILYYAIANGYHEILDIFIDANQANVGVSVYDIKDKQLRTSLFYAIDANDALAVRKLINAGANTNARDVNGMNVLHFAVRNRSLEICELIAPHIADIDSNHNSGESALHIACNLGLSDIAAYLLQLDANPNVKSVRTEVSPIHYATLTNSRDTLLRLLEHDSLDVNAQDIYGNTVMHYIVTDNYIELFNIITESQHASRVNYNIWNADGNIPAHIVLSATGEASAIVTCERFLDVIIPRTNVSIQDNHGDTCLHYLVRYDLWRRYYDALVTKRLDIFAINAGGRSVTDELKDNKSEYDAFMDLVVDSYLHRLRARDNIWHLEWENVCKKPFDALTKQERKTHKLRDDGTNFNIVCRELVQERLRDMIRRVHSGEILNCYDRSFPMKHSLVCVDIARSKCVSFCTFTGSTLDVIAGLISLIRKHNNACTLFRRGRADSCAFYKSIGVIANARCDFLSMEIIWVHQQLHMTDQFYDLFRACRASGTRQFVIMPIGIELPEGNHAGYLIYDARLNEVERFEPHGSEVPVGLYYNPDLLDELLAAKFVSLDVNIKYVRPRDYLPKIGFQMFDVGETHNRHIGDPAGFCALWSIWYVDMRLMYADMRRERLVMLLIEAMRRKGLSFRSTIRGYGEDVVRIRDDLLARAGLGVNDWLNDLYTDEQLTQVMDAVTNEFK